MDAPSPTVGRVVVFALGEDVYQHVMQPLRKIEVNEAWARNFYFFDHIQALRLNNLREFCRQFPWVALEAF